jgi:outer membrane immunogenic protein
MSLTSVPITMKLQSGRCSAAKKIMTRGIGRRLGDAASMGTAIAFGALLMASPVLAADLPVMIERAPSSDAIYAEPVFNWSGTYVGAAAGWGFGSDRTTEFVSNVYLQKFDLKPSGLLGSLYAGYNYQFDSFVVGVEADGALANVKSNFTDAPGGTPFAGDPGGHGAISMKWQASARLRAGYAIDRFLVFAAGGWSIAEHKMDVTNLTSQVTEHFASTQQTWTVGGGVEYAVTDNLIARIEYRYTPFEARRNRSVTAYPGFGISADQQPRLNDIRAGISYKF